MRGIHAVQTHTHLYFMPLRNAFGTYCIYVVLVLIIPPAFAIAERFFSGWSTHHDTFPPTTLLYIQRQRLCASFLTKVVLLCHRIIIPLESSRPVKWPAIIALVLAVTFSSTIKESRLISSSYILQTTVAPNSVQFRWCFDADIEFMCRWFVIHRQFPCFIVV